MSAGILPSGSLCLFSGALLGGLFLACKLLRILLHGGRLCAAVLDILFCLCCAFTAFLCALAVDRGRLRMFQAGLQILGAWGIIAALDPMVEGAARILRRIWSKLAAWIRSFFRNWVRRPLAAFCKGVAVLAFRPVKALAARRRSRRACRLARQKRRTPSKGPTYSGKAGASPRKRKKTSRKRKNPKKPLEKLT
ncbi:hypothetical protein D7X94_06740 [Acutalibacter sp. 1XD8-33]|uniref:spore cortex biosynthesis protein YabQ n=1 Tax=Acutalibacter sp. 1XD8-33 TaxID=2320081 RepID=UPI000EA00EBA|nr:spore cortex biosynthesis protein YabQ [Acutalibacter sp. 1XD8-33]RKJ40752.1 hypothetical protein D7X94_06740 [Acutalibacter sp. 1XD8-33]